MILRQLAKLLVDMVFQAKRRSIYLNNLLSLAVIKRYMPKLKKSTNKQKNP